MNKTLLVMAAGMGSRFGGLKQITPVDDENNFLIDYSIYDAKRNGFNKVVFVIKEELLNDFEETIGKRIKNIIPVSYAFQRLEDIPSRIDISKRTKPWGTVQAVLAAKDVIDEDFVVINADDFYGHNAYKNASAFLDNNHNPHEYACISYEYGESCGEGIVKRGVIETNNNEIMKIVESSIKRDNSKIIASPLNGKEDFTIREDTPVSMNMFAFKKDIFVLLEEYFKDFFNNSEEAVLNSEALLPEALQAFIESKKIKLMEVKSESEWIGMTYKEDLEIVKNKLKELKNNKTYPNYLWRNHE